LRESLGNGADSLQLKFLKKLDRSLGKVLVGILPPPGRPGPCRFDRVLFVRPGGIGDVVQLVPSLNLLKKHAPACKIDLLVEKRNMGALGLCPDIGHVFLYDCLSDILELARGRYDVIIDTEQWHRLSAVVVRCIRSDWKIGFATNERCRMFTHQVDYSQKDYEAFSFYRLLEPLGIRAPQELLPSFLSVPDSARVKVSSLLLEYPYGKFVVMSPFASIPERQWGVSCFWEVAQWIFEQGFGVVVVGGAGDRQASEGLTEGLDAFNLTGRTNLVEMAAVMERSSLVLSGDSGPLHIAVGLGRPTVSLFGPGIEDKWAPQGPRHIVLNKNLPCSPCTKFGYTPQCLLNAQCMKEIAVDEVIAAIQQLLPGQK
jgi:ADP-heptose:LPS heptosyltransferase